MDYFGKIIDAIALKKEHWAGIFLAAIVAGLIGGTFYISAIKEQQDFYSENLKNIGKLSMNLGVSVDLTEQSYKQVVSSRFNQLRKEANTVVEQQYKPHILDSLLTDSVLFSIIISLDTAKIYEVISILTEKAIEQIERERQRLIDPLNFKEASLFNQIESTFQPAKRAQALITAWFALLDPDTFSEELIRPEDVEELGQQITIVIDESTENLVKEIEELVSKIGKFSILL